MSDITNFRLSRYANEVVDKFTATGKFDFGTSVAKFAFAYAIENFYSEFNPSTYVIPDSDGSNYSVGSFDDLAPYIEVLYPDTETPYVYVRALIVFGLTEIGKLIEKEGLQKIYSLCEKRL